MDDQFQYCDDCLACEGVTLESIASAVGTPTYVYSRKMLRESVRTFDEAFEDVPHLVCYGIKANSNQTLLRRFVEWGIGFDAVSGGELFRALQAGAAHSRIILSGVGKTEEEIRYALNTGILFVSVESPAELDSIAAVAEGIGRPAHVVLRTNPDVDARTHPYISTGLKSHKFGIALDEAGALAVDAQQRPGIEVVGIGCHIGSQITDLGPFAEAARSITGLAADLKRAGLPLRYLDFGGGLGVSYDDETPPAPADYAETLIEASRGLKMTLILEPGRVIVGPAGALICRVVRRKKQGEKQFVIVDAGMNDLIRPPLYGSFHRIRPVRPRREDEVIDLVGPICESTDFFARDREVGRLESGDLVAVMTVGAYGSVLASNYNSRPRPAEVLVDGDSFMVIRRRESYEDLIRLEK
jgi:diaminopimelate decarboxylase